MYEMNSLRGSITEYPDIFTAWKNNHMHSIAFMGFSAGVTAWTALQVMHLRWQSVLQVAQTLPNPLIDYVIQGAT